MNVKKIYEHAKLHVDGDFPWVHARRWLNEGMRLIATTCETGSITDTVDIDAIEENKWHKLPSDTLKIIRVYKNGNKFNDYREDINSIYLKDIGTYQVDVKRLPKDIGKESDTPEIHEAYHFPLSYWVGAKEQLRFNPDSPDGQRLEATFYLEIQQVDNMLNKSNRVRKIKVW